MVEKINALNYNEEQKKLLTFFSEHEPSRARTMLRDEYEVAQKAVWKLQEEEGFEEKQEYKDAEAYYMAVVDLDRDIQNKLYEIRNNNRDENPYSYSRALRNAERARRRSSGMFNTMTWSDPVPMTIGDTGYTMSSNGEVTDSNGNIIGSAFERRTTRDIQASLDHLRSLYRDLTTEESSEEE